MAGVLCTARSYFDGLVHEAARADALTCARHRAFIVPRLIGSCVALGAVPLYLALRGTPSPLEAAIFGWMVIPLLLAVYLSRTGRYEHAHVLSALALTALITFLAWGSGGIASFAAVLLILVPLEAAFAASRRVVAAAALFAVAGAIALIFAGTSAPQWLGAVDGPTFAALGVVAATLYAGGIAFGVEALARKQSEYFETEEERYELLARNMTDVISRHGRNGAVRFISPAAHTLFGVPAERLMGQGLFDLVHVADRPAYLNALSDAANGETRSIEFRVRCDQSDGKTHFLWVEMRCRPLDQGGTAANGEVVGVIRDVSERKTQEEAIAQTRAESERAQEGKSRFLATMSHELRTPLNAIIGFSDMLSNGALNLPAARQREYATLINDSGRHLLSVVNGILDMSKMESGAFEITPEPFAPGLVLASCCDLLTLRAREAGIALNLRTKGQLPEIVADRRALSQILLNLLSNAIKFTDRGGRVTVSAHCDIAHVIVVVEDTGVGIGEDDLPRLGEAFFQARSSYDRRHDGTGLGLSIVKGLVNLHGGSTEIRSRLGEGTRVTVRLPLNCEAKAPAPRPVALAENIKPAQSEAPIQVRKRA